MVAMPPTLATSIAPVRNVHPTDPLHKHNWVITLTEAVPDESVLRIGDPPHSEPVTVEQCTGNGPYVVKLANRISRPHCAGTSVTVIDVGAEQP
jgi:hypothetical protein